MPETNRRCRQNGHLVPASRGSRGPQRRGDPSRQAPTDRCDVAIGWHIDQGSAGAIDLSGLNVIGIYQTPDALMGDFRAQLYIDEHATSQQRHALVEIFSGRWGGQMGLMRKAGLQVKEVQYVPI